MTLHALSASGPAPPDADLSLVRAELISNLRDVELMSQVHRAVEACTRTPRGSLIARELVGDVVGDIYRGALSSDPRVPFQKRILAEVRRRIHRTAEKQKHHVSLDTLGEKDAPVAPDSVARDRDDERSAAELRSRVARARERVGDDPPTLQLLTLYELGITRKRDALRLGMTESAYRAARRRLATLFASPAAAGMEGLAESDAARSVDPDLPVARLVAAGRIGPLSASNRTGRGARGMRRPTIAAARRR